MEIKLIPSFAREVTLKKIICLIFISVFTFSCSNKEDGKESPKTQTEDKKTDEPVSNKYNFFENYITKKSEKTEDIIIYGKVKSVNNYSVVPAVQGQITKLFVTNGSYVKAGQLLANIDDKMLRTEEGQLEGDYQVALSEIQRTKQQYDSAKKLFDTGIMPKQDLDNTYFNLEQAKVRAKAAKSKISALNIQLGYSKVFSENSGYIFNLLPVGSMVGPSLTPMANINAAPSDIEFNVPFNLKLYPGENLYIDSKAYSINSIYSDPATNNRVASVKVKGNEFVNSQPVNAIYKKVIHGIQVPQPSVISYQGSPVVFRIDKEKDGCYVTAIPIKIIFSDNKSYLISGIDNNVKIIAKGAEILEDKENIECEK
jgi:multidrug efflux pump subunit AcrA (membrane-fusion protein)